MKLDFTVEISKCDDIYTLEDEIINKAAENFVYQIVGTRYDNSDMYTRLQNVIIEKLENIMDDDFKISVANKVTENLANKFEKTKQYKLLKADQEVMTDSLIKTGLKDLVADLVRSEMKKVFK